MKKISLVLGLVLAACGNPSKSNSDVAGFPGFQVQLQEKAMSFSRDLRPVDGDLVQIDLAPVAGGYKASVRTAGYDHLAGQSFDKTETIGEKMKCSFNKDADGVISSLKCTEDLRPVDGDLKELSIESGYDAKLRTAYFDRINGQAVDETKDLGEGLKLSQAQ